MAVLVLSLFVWACSSSPQADEPSGPAVSVETTQPEQNGAPVVEEPSPEVSETAPSLPENSNSENVVESQPPVVEAWPPLSLRPSKEWPFYEWDSASVVVYNLKEFGPSESIFAWTAKAGLNASAAKQAQLTKKQASTSLKLLSETLGGLNVSKCAFPRHAIVFYAGEVPVGSINVCFECGDILISPLYKQDSNWSDKKYKMYGKLMKRYDRVFPKWKKFFESELQLDSDWKKLLQ